MKIKKKTILISIGGMLVVVLVVCVFGSFFFYNLAIKRSEKSFLRNNSDLAQNKSNKDAIETSNVKEDSQPTPVDNGGWVDSQPYETWNVTTTDGLKLVGYYVPAKEPTTKTVILAHGYTSKGKDMGGFAKFYYEKLGYNVLMPDDRGHGGSEGDYIGFGWPDRKDYLLWIQKVLDVVGDDAKIVLHGISMGGATVMMVSGEENLPEQVKVFVEDCGYSSVDAQLKYQLKRMYNLPSFPLLPMTSLVTQFRAGYNFYEASSVKQVEKNKTPMLFIHGDADTFVPTEMIYEVYDACKAEKDIFIVEGAGHGMAFGTDKEGYEKKVAEFVGRFIK